MVRVVFCCSHSPLSSSMGDITSRSENGAWFLGGGSLQLSSWGCCVRGQSPCDTQSCPEGLLEGTRKCPHRPLWERKWAKASLQKARQQFLLCKCADQPWFDHITQEHVLQTRKAVADRISSYMLLQGCPRSCPISQFFVVLFDVLFFLYVVRLGPCFLITFPPLLSSLHTPSAVQEQSLSPMKALPHQPFLLTPCGFDCYITCFLLSFTGVFSFKTLSSMY